MSLSDAMADLKSEIQNGRDLAEAIVEIAKDYALNPKLMERKWSESGFTIEGTKAVAVACDEKVNHAKRLAEVFVKWEAAVKIANGANPVRKRSGIVQGDKYTIIGYQANRRYPWIAVNHNTLNVYELGNEANALCTEFVD